MAIKLMASEIVGDEVTCGAALAVAGESERLRNDIFEALRQAEAEAEDPSKFREQVRWPLILGLLSRARTHRVRLASGLVFEIDPDSRIEQALLLSRDAHPDHVWEPQTTKLLTALSAGVAHIIVGGAYIGDHVLPIADICNRGNPPGAVHAFEPMEYAFERLLRNLELNRMTNVVAHRLSLWDRSDVRLNVDGARALASSRPADEEVDETDRNGEVVRSITIDDYVDAHHLDSVGLIMLDTEGGEERALLGARQVLERPNSDSPNVIFEIHRNFVDWTPGLEHTSVVRLLTSRGYAVFAIRDFQGNYPMANHPIEVVPVDRVYLEGPPHGFNLLASKDPDLVGRLGLRVVERVSPKLILEKDPALHHPVGGLR